MREIGFGMLGLAVGLGVGLAVLQLFRRHASAAGMDGRIDARLEVQAAELRRIADATAARDAVGEHVLAELGASRRALEELNVRDEERRARRTQEAEVIRRLATVLAGGASKGRAGENVLREHLAELPPGMLVTDFRVNGRVVEFGLRLPDGRRLPIDSKWSALAELEALSAAQDAGQREACARAVERIVGLRAKEVAQYLDPSLTAPVAVAAVPDAAYEVLRRVHAEAFVKGVVIVPYSTALPVTLFLYSLVQRFGDAGDLQACVSEVAGILDSMEGILENKIVRASTMLTNGADEFRSQMGKARGSIARAAGGEPPKDANLPGLQTEIGPDLLEVVR